MFGTMRGYGKTLDGNLKYDKDYFKIEDIAQRLFAGTGSTGTPRYYVLIQGDSKKTKDDRAIENDLLAIEGSYQHRVER